MTDNDTHDETATPSVETDGGAVTDAAQQHQNTDYLQQEVNILSPSTSFMRDHLRVVWTGFIVWALIVFGPVTLTAIAPGAMTTTLPVIGFPLHYFLVAFGGPTGALLLAFWYARKRDQLDEKYDIDPSTVESGGQGGSGDTDDTDAAATDGGVQQ